MNDFLLGMLSSLTAALIIYILRNQIGPIINVIFFRIFPKVDGEYRVFDFEYSDDDYEDEDEDDINIPPNTRNFKEVADYLKQHNDPSSTTLATFRQFGNKIWGEMKTIEDGKIVEIIKFKGVVKPSRVLILNSEDVTEGHHDFGTMLLNISQDSNYLKGSRSFLCAICANAGNDYLVFEKIK